jgi:LacI family transcriptional regulator
MGDHMAKDRKLYLNERTTIRDVAQEAGVSLTTVSHALNGYKDVSEKTRQKVMEVARRLDYMPDEAGRSLRGIQKKTIALLLAGELPEEDPSGMMFGLTSGIYKIAQKMEYEFTILTMPTNKQIKISFGQICKKKKLTGIIVDGLAMDMPYYEQIKNSEIPCVLVDVALESDHVCEVSVDNEKADSGTGYVERFGKAEKFNTNLPRTRSGKKTSTFHAIKDNVAVCIVMDN